MNTLNKDERIKDLKEELEIAILEKEKLLTIIDDLREELNLIED